MSLAIWWAAALGSADAEEFQKLAAARDAEDRVRAVELARKAGDPRAAAVLVGLMGDDHPRVRFRAVRALAELDGLEAALRAALRHPRALVRQGACEALAARGDRSAPLADALRDPDPGVRAAAAEGLERLNASGAAPALQEAFRKQRDWPTRTAALSALARLDPARAREVVATAAADGPYQVRMVAAETWARIDRDGASDGLGALVEDRDWRVRVAAFEACRELRTRGAVGWLVDRFPQESGRLRWDVLQALEDLTGKDLGPNPGSWRDWWAANRETFVVKPPGGKGSSAPADTQASFFSIPVFSRRIIFLLDLSGSMREPEHAREGAPTKLDVARAGTLATVRALDPEARFGIVGLGSDGEGRYALRDEKTWGRRLALHPAAPANKAAAEQFLRGLEARGWTNLFDGIEYAFSDPDVDTVYLYSDGGASKGTFVAAGEILTHLARLNRFRKIVVHTVEVPGERNPEDNRRLLVNIARRTGGLYRVQEKK